jgi:hypothetical protein
MSQQGIIDVESGNPQIPTSFITNTGTAIPLLNVLEILGGQGITTSGSGNTITISGVNATAGPSAGAASTGIASFDSASFTVTNGFVQLSGATSGIKSIGVQTGTSPIVPTAGGLVTINGAVVGAGTNPIRSDGTGANILAIEVQISQAVAATDPTKVGLANFDSASFAVDSNGFVTLKGGTEAIDSIGVDATSGGGTNPVLPTVAGLITVNGAVIAASTTPVRTVSTAANIYQIQVQTSQAIAAADSTKIGLSNFDSSSFAVAATGFVTLSTTGAGKTITGDSGGALSPTANNWNIVGSGSTTTSGAVSTLTVALTGLTNHAVLVGAGTATITKVGPTATTGQVLQNNAAADPTYSTATYPSTTTVSQILYSSATNVVSGLATANSATLVTTSAGVPVMSATMTNGQMIIGSTGATPVAGTITSTGGTITVTTGAGTLNLEVAGGGFTWTDVTTATQAMLIENGYITDRSAGVVYTLPATAVLGAKMIVMGKLGITTITPNANQQILLSSASGTVGVTGTIVGTNVGDCITLVATTSGASTVWRAESFVGNWTVN